MLLDGPAREFDIVGLFRIGDTDGLGPVTFAAFDLATAQQAFDADGTLDRIYVQRDPDVPELTLQERIDRHLGEQYEVLTVEQAARQTGAPVGSVSTAPLTENSKSPGTQPNCASGWK